MNGLSSTALSGLTAAQTDLRQRAHHLANLGTEGFTRARTERSTLPGAGVTAMTSRAMTSGHAMAEDLVGQRQAAHAFAANLAVFRTADAMAGTLLDLRG